jgi:hypothetical protein
MPFKDYFKYLGPGFENRIRCNYVIEKSRIVDFVLQYESFINEQWQAVVRYDVAHGFFHRDILFPNGRQEKTPIDLPSLEVAARFAEEDLVDNWELYKERYLNNIK